MLIFDVLIVVWIFAPASAQVLSGAQIGNRVEF